MLCGSGCLFDANAVWTTQPGYHDPHTYVPNNDYNTQDFPKLTIYDYSGGSSGTYSSSQQQTSG
eukprot:3827544-Pyramimonas_sp.AAC.1